MEMMKIRWMYCARVHSRAVQQLFIARIKSRKIDNKNDGKTEDYEQSGE